MMDYESCRPNVPALRRILFALIAGAVVTFGIALSLILRPPPHTSVTHTARKCTCKGAGACCLHTIRP
jgi:hypothetical protein